MAVRLSGTPLIDNETGSEIASETQHEPLSESELEDLVATDEEDEDDEDEQDEPEEVGPEDLGKQDVALTAKDVAAVEDSALRRIADARALIRDAKQEMDDCREELKTAKGEWEAAVKKLLDLIDAVVRPLPLFDGKAQETGESEPEPDADDDDAPEEKTPAEQEIEAWKSVPIDKLQEFGLPVGIVKILAESDITTIGKLADWSDDDKPLTTIPKIGQAKADKIDAAMDAFWAADQA